MKKLVLSLVLSTIGMYSEIMSMNAVQVNRTGRKAIIPLGIIGDKLILNTDEGVRIFIRQKNDYKNVIKSVEIKGRVTKIPGEMFNGFSKLENVTISDDVKEIGMGAFSNCQKLRKINIPKNLKSISFGLFSGCTNLTEINIPSNIESIGEFAFRNTNLRTIIIPNSVQEIKYHAFNNCKELTHVVIPKTTTTYKTAFDDRKLLEWVDPTFDGEIDTSEEVLDKYDENGEMGFVFNHKDGTLVINCGYDLEEFRPVKDKYKDNVRTIIFRDRVAEIPMRAFTEFPALECVVIPPSVELIGSLAFSRCPNLSNVTISHGVKNIGAAAFSQCPALTKIVIPSSVKKIDCQTFNKCTNLRHVEIRGRKTEVNEAAFDNCTGLERIDINRNNKKAIKIFKEGIVSLKDNFIFQDGILTINNNDGAFDCFELPNDNRNAITSLIVKDEVTDISQADFCLFPNLTEISIPSSIQKIGGGLEFCKNLRSVAFRGSKSPKPIYTFAGCPLDFIGSENRPDCLTEAVANQTNLSNFADNSIAFLNFTHEDQQSVFIELLKRKIYDTLRSKYIKGTDALTGPQLRHILQLLSRLGVTMEVKVLLAMHYMFKNDLPLRAEWVKMHRTTTIKAFKSKGEAFLRDFLGVTAYR